MPEYEIEIADYMRILWRRKWLILFGTFILVIIAGSISLVLPKTYESKGIVELGKMEGTLIEPPNLIRARIEYGPIANMFIRDSGLDISKKDIRLEIETRGNAGYVMLTAKAPSPDIASKYIQYLVDDLASTHREKITKFIELKEQNENELKQRIASLEESIKEMEEISRSKSTTTRDNVEKFILQNALAGKENLLMDLRSRYTASQMRDITTKTFETNLLFLKTPAKPSQPKVKLNMLIALILGLMIFMAISLFLEYNKRERHNNKEKT